MESYSNLIIQFLQISYCCTLLSHILWRFLCMARLSGGNTFPGCHRAKAELHTGQGAGSWNNIKPPRCTFPRCTADITAVGGGGAGGGGAGAEPRAAGEIFICCLAGCFLIDGCSPGGLRGGWEQLALHLTPCRMAEVTVQVRPDKWPLAQSPTHKHIHTHTRAHMQLRHTHLHQGQVLERQRSICKISLRRIQQPRHGTRYMIKRS